MRRGLARLFADGSTRWLGGHPAACRSTLGELLRGPCLLGVQRTGPDSLVARAQAGGPGRRRRGAAAQQPPPPEPEAALPSRGDLDALRSQREAARLSRNYDVVPPVQAMRAQGIIRELEAREQAQRRLALGPGAGSAAAGGGGPALTAGGGGSGLGGHMPSAPHAPALTAPAAAPAALGSGGAGASGLNGLNGHCNGVSYGSGNGHGTVVTSQQQQDWGQLNGAQHDPQHPTHWYGNGHGDGSSVPQAHDHPQQYGTPYYGAVQQPYGGDSGAWHQPVQPAEGQAWTYEQQQWYEQQQLYNSELQAQAPEATSWNGHAGGYGHGPVAAHAVWDAASQGQAYGQEGAQRVGAAATEAHAVQPAEFQELGPGPSHDPYGAHAVAVHDAVHAVASGGLDGAGSWQTQPSWPQQPATAQQQQWQQHRGYSTSASPSGSASHSGPGISSSGSAPAPPPDPVRAFAAALGRGSAASLGPGVGPTGPGGAVAGDGSLLTGRRRRAGQTIDAVEAVRARTADAAAEGATGELHGGGGGGGAATEGVQGYEERLRRMADVEHGVLLPEPPAAGGLSGPSSPAAAAEVHVQAAAAEALAAEALPFAARAAEAGTGAVAGVPPAAPAEAPAVTADEPPKPKRKTRARATAAPIVDPTTLPVAAAEESAPAAKPKRPRARATAVPATPAELAAAAAGDDDLDAVAAAAAAAAKPKRPRAPATATATIPAPPAADGYESAGDDSASAAAASRVRRLPASAAAVAAPPAFLDPALLPPLPPQELPLAPGFWEAAEGWASKQPLMSGVSSDVLVIDTPEVAQAVVARLMASASRPYPGAAQRSNPPVGCRYFACDTEVAYIDVTTQTPVGHGVVLCFSVYGGDDLDFADLDPGYEERIAAWIGDNPAAGPPGTDAARRAAARALRKDRIWVDVWPEVELQAGPEGEEPKPVMDGRYVRLKPHTPILDAWRPFFEDEEVKKVWHNYGFDRHVLENMRIACRGFGGDTLHMARLADASRSGKKTYGLDSLTGDEKIMRHFTPHKQDVPPRERTGHLRRARAAGAGGSALGPPGLGPAGFGLPGSLGAAGLGAEATGGSLSPAARKSAETAQLVRAKVGMKERFGMFKVTGGLPGKVPTLPPIQALHTLPLFRSTWIDYSALDAKATWQLREALEVALRQERWEMEPSLAQQLGYLPDGRPDAFLHLWHFYASYWLDFGELLTEMERRGMMVNRGHLAAAQQRAEADREAAVAEFLDWADSKVPGARYMNPGSGAQIRMLLFPDHLGHTTKAKAAEAAKEAKAAKAAGKKAAADAEAAVHLVKVPNPRYDEEKAQGIKTTRWKPITLHGIWGPGVPGRLTPELMTETGSAAVSIRVLRGLAGKPGAARKARKALLEARAAAAADEAARREAAAAAAAADRTAVPIVGDELEDAMEALAGASEGGNGNGGGEAGGEEEAEVAAEEEVPGSGFARVVSDPGRLAALEAEAKEKGLGRLYAACGGGEEGLMACIAVEALCEVSAIDKLLSAFIIPLQSDDISTTQHLPAADGSLRPVHRVHCSLNINTETGRLSARRPNLQNQPALEKDRYKVRQAFTADVASGRTLVVADYGQLELRILAHMTDCQSMREAFVLGGDFHSRTAVGMYDYIKKDIDDGGCYLEWEGEGKPDKPLVKDKYAAERRKAKVLNFSIAYGKTAHGLAADFKTSVQEAQETVDKWYSDRFEVRQWQEETRKGARQEGKVRTLLGRTRPLPNINSPDFRLSGHSNRAAINTPIQGSAADVAAAAMVAIAHSQELADTGFKLLMQIHDEVILEGPKETSPEAQRLVMALMANPWAELAQHWNAEGAWGLAQGPEWHRGRPWLRPGQEGPLLPGGHVAGTWLHGGNAKEGAKEVGKDGAKEGAKEEEAMPLLVELATDCNVADTWYEAK
ncbi:hypothetical protein HYH03_003981 [Edaphochlamys debaryana]|uniref:DNA-directed DNA polymerase family A palm domain-containing protein n=1 Tax=Edaphochlamys debaryana TaxID=47281 RepID=A0A835YCD9_9CHLO|nr:hypothetical protein HYH03_003981 [Edaphochlamys debaryana]|eukprot:KAG2498231.1 hypothetical protein HYH03_003981 [Edaphochlamys debaryana]